MQTSPIHYEHGDQTLTLHRYPPEQRNRSLQAWDAADELLIDYMQAHSTPSSLLILNDQFGALACALHQYAPIVVTDSLLAKLALHYNLQQNGLTEVTVRTALDEWPTSEHILLKIPNNHSYLRFQLRRLKALVPAGSVIVAAAKAKDIHANLLQIFQEEIGPTTASLTVKKCRLITAVAQGAVNRHPNGQFPKLWSIALPYHSSPALIANHANVFSKDQLDIGARFLLDHLPTVVAGERVIDLGCGNGVLGLAMLQQQPDAHVVFTDESYMAIESSRLNVEQNIPQSLQHCEFIADDCLTSQADLTADWIICNPPFHQQHAITDHIAWQMFTDARRVLKVGGRLRVVCNRHLDYGDKLSRLFGGCIHIASNAKFTVLETIRRK